MQQNDGIADGYASPHSPSLSVSSREPASTQPVLPPGLAVGETTVILLTPPLHPC